MTRSVELDRSSQMIMEEEEADLKEYMGIISRYKWLILSITVVLTAIAAYIAYTTPPVYRSTAILLIDSQKKRIVSIEEVYDVPVVNEEYFETQNQILQSRGLALRVIEQLNLADHPAFDPAAHESRFSFDPRRWLPEGLFSEEAQAAAEVAVVSDGERGRLNEVLGMYYDGLDVSPVPDSQLIQISFDSTDPVLAAEVPNALAEAYIERHIQSRTDITEDAVGWITERLDELRVQVKESEKALQDYRDQEKLVDVGGVDSIAARELNEITTELVDARRDLSEARTLLNQINSLKGQPIVAFGSIPAVLADTGVRAAKENQVRAQSAVSELSGRYGPMHPKMIAAQTELDEANQNLTAQIRNVISSVGMQYEVASDRVEELSQALAATKQDVAGINRKQATLVGLEREVANNRELYDLFMTRLKEADITSDMQSANARLVDEAAVPSDPVHPKKALIMLVTFFLGLTGSTFLAFITEALDNTLKYSADVEKKLRMPVLGVLPKVPGQLIGGKRRSIRYYSGHNESIFAENVRTIRTNTLLTSIGEKKKLIVVTSSIQGEGKSTVSVNLALSLGQMGKALLIDADMRNPVVAGAFNLKRRNAIGLSNYISGAHPLENCIHRFREDCLDVMPAGAVPTNPLELLSSERFASFINKVKHEYDYVVVDSAPVIPVSDAVILGGFANDILYVVKANDTPYQLAQEGVKRLQQQVSGAAIGMVLNQVSFSQAPGRYGAYLSDYYRTYGYRKAT